MSAPGVERRGAERGRGAGEAGRRGRLDDAVVLDVGAAGGEVRVRGRLGVAEDRRDARVGALEEGGPLVAGAGAEGVGEQGAQGGPLAGVEPVGGGVGEVEQAQQLGVERGLERADGEPAAVARLVDVVEGGAGVEQVGAAAVGPEAGRDEPDDERGEVGRAVDDGGVDDLAAAARAGLEQRGEHADDEVEGAAAEVADEVDRHLGRSAGAADGVQRAGDGDVADVVTRRPGRADRPGPSRSSGRRRAAGCGRGSRPGPSPSRSATPGR